ncbi:LysR family transcriptional regulator [Shewanella schlegeliana]|uniref:LysR family transcriptional regulator n=1 Tax=Shewanella schlegeliana TaxID=190308 RepID=A0ABS1SWA7_9GAMM|nr:LysR family transcriptional regulator [Shewanella schlegeliana]MBL4912822.1 LysR family transcriptional regulator [Shewanella schlegeliana]MCL1109081.1 LysR family transcriptional regulator [Shewanella schlegeliana]GIU23097.1 LysR family transcriptional regulator [Shewanella schlegeliana]
MKKLTSINLSTIEILCQLYLKNSTKDVAVTLGLSQPKVSRALNALRDVFDDPLFIRKNNKLVATELTHALYDSFSEMLACTDSIESDVINSITAPEPPIVISTVPQLEIGLAQQVINEANKSRINPNLAISTSAWSDRSEQQLVDGDIDAAICFTPSTRKELLSKSVIQHRGGYLIARAEHPIWDSPTIDNMIDYPIVKLVTMPFPANKSPIGVYAKSKGKQVQVYATAPDLGSAASSLLNSNAFMIVGVKSAVNFLSSIKGLRASKIDYPQDKLLLKDFSHPTVYLWLRRSLDGKVLAPLWLQQTLESYIVNAHK